jgi:hypothetical protein
MVAFRCGVAVLRLAPLLALVVTLLPARGALAEEEAVEPLPAVKQEPLTAELASPSRNSTGPMTSGSFSMRRNGTSWA